LTRVFGVEHLNRAEDVVQETLVRALQTWPYYGIPRNPAAWITQVAKKIWRSISSDGTRSSATRKLKSPV